MDRDALIAHFVLLGWEPVWVVCNQSMQRVAMTNRDRVVYIDASIVSRYFGRVVNEPAARALVVASGDSGWDGIADHQLREFYRALSPDRSPA